MDSEGEVTSILGVEGSSSSSFIKGFIDSRVLEDVRSVKQRGKYIPLKEQVKCCFIMTAMKNSLEVNHISGIMSSTVIANYMWLVTQIFIEADRNCLSDL